MLHLMTDKETSKLLINELCSIIGDYGFRDTKTGEDISLYELLSLRCSDSRQRFYFYLLSGPWEVCTGLC